jgi:hypothetical protein
MVRKEGAALRASRTASIRAPSHTTDPAPMTTECSIVQARSTQLGPTVT